MIKKFLKLFFVLTFFASCNRNVQKTNHTIKAKNFDFNYFKSKAKVDFESDGQQVSANLNIRMKDDSIIWLSITKFGKEAARLKMTPDSAYFIQKYPNDDKFYSILSIKDYLKKVGVNMSFESFQDLFFGDYPLKVEGKDKVSVKDSLIELKQERNGVKINSFLHQSNSKIKSSTIVSNNDKDTLDIQYLEYEWINGFSVPKSMTIYGSQWVDKTRYRTNAKVELNGSEFVDEELSFNFTVPEGYEKR
jgi:hypothetical protein